MITGLTRCIKHKSSSKFCFSHSRNVCMRIQKNSREILFKNVKPPDRSHSWRKAGGILYWVTIKGIEILLASGM